MKSTLGKEERLKSRKLIERVFREGKSFALFPFRVFYLPLPPSPIAASSLQSPGAPTELPVQAGASAARTKAPVFLQAGFGAGNKNFKKAVDRNRIKRLSREAYRLQKQVLETPLREKNKPLAVFFIYVGKELPDYATVSGKIGLALQRLLKEIDHER